MSDNSDFKQKPPKQRFLFILGIVGFVLFVVLALMVMFWNKLPLNMPKSQRYVFGGIILIYSFLRFSRLLRR